MMLAAQGENYPVNDVRTIDLQTSTSGDPEGRWIRIRGELVGGLFQLMKKPMPTELVEGGMEGRIHVYCILHELIELSTYILWDNEHPVDPGECGFHFPGARIPPITYSVGVFDVLSGNPEEYIWRPVTGTFDLSKIDDMNPVLGGHTYSGNDEDIRLLYIARSITGDGNVHLGYVSIGNGASICRDGGVLKAEHYEVLAHNKSNVNAVRALLGTYHTDGHWTRTKEAERYSSAIDLSSCSWEAVPRVLLGLSTLDIGLNEETPIRVQTFPQNITKEGFICNARSWGNGILHNVVVDWIAIEQPSWECGVFNSEDVKISDERDMSSERRVNFSKPFEDGPPMVFVCFSGIHMLGKWNARVYATSVDPAGFTVAIVSCGEEGPNLVKLKSAAITWIAVPGSDVTKKNAWIGTFATGRRAGGINEYDGHVDFGFTFKWPPKVFVGLRQFSASNERNLRLVVSTSNVTRSGMDWQIKKWHDTVLFGAGASFLAVDVM